MNRPVIDTVWRYTKMDNLSLCTRQMRLVISGSLDQFSGQIIILVEY
jgi:hypothetical protein